MAFPREVKSDVKWDGVRVFTANSCLLLCGGRSWGLCAGELEDFLLTSSDESTSGRKGTGADVSGCCFAFLLGARFLPEGLLAIYTGKIPFYFRNVGLPELGVFCGVFVLEAALCSPRSREEMLAGFLWTTLSWGIPRGSPSPGEKPESPEPGRKIY